jgi:hypothetical protein
MYVITEFYENSEVILFPKLPMVVTRFSAIVANDSQQIYSIIRLFGLCEQFILFKGLLLQGHPISYASN